jgi:DNA-binding response OmpR family regulator
LVKIGKQLEEATQTKLIFFTNISHEFRTPLTLILGTLDNMINSREYNEDQLNQLKLIHRNGIRLLRLINQLLDFRKLEKAKMKLQAANHDFSSFLQGVVNSFIDLAQRKDIKLKLEKTDYIEDLYFDKDKLDKVIFNLLSNAFKFTPQGGEISIKVKLDSMFLGSEESSAVSIIISDTGIGMSKEVLNRVFERYFHYQDKQQEQFPGSGIGLALAKGLIELHHGRISVESIEQQGTTFNVFLPLGKKHLRPDEFAEPGIMDQQSTGHRSIPEETDFTPDFDRKDDIKIEQKSEDGEKSTVLIVEDNEDVRNFIKDSLGDQYEIVEAENGKLGLEKINEENPDLVISDVMMPVMDGFEMIRQIRSDLKTSHIPVIVLTARASMEHKLEGLELGADSYIPKPFNSRHLQVRVKKLIESRLKIRDHYRDKLSFDDNNENSIGKIDRRFMNKAIKSIEDNIQNPDFNVEELSQLLGLSRVHLYRKIKQLTGMSASEFIRSVRLKRSKQLLRDRGLTVSEIAYEVGFSSPSYFTKCFKEMFNLSPKEYQEQTD